MGWDWMFLNLSKSSPSNVLKMFLNILVSTNEPEAPIHFIELAAALAGKKCIK